MLNSVDATIMCTPKAATTFHDEKTGVPDGSGGDCMQIVIAKSGAERICALEVWNCGHCWGEALITPIVGGPETASRVDNRFNRYQPEQGRGGRFAGSIIVHCRPRCVSPCYWDVHCHR